MSGNNSLSGNYSIVIYKNRNGGEKISDSNNIELFENGNLFYRTYATREARDYQIARMKESGAILVKTLSGLSEYAYFRALSVLNNTPLRKELLESIVKNVKKEIENANQDSGKGVKNANLRKRKLR